MGELSPWHLLIVAGVFVVLLGAKRLPDAARSLGKSMRIMKTELRGLNNEASETPSTSLPAVPPNQPDAADASID